MHVENVKASRHWHLWREFADDRWIPRTKSQLRGKLDFHLSGSNILNTMGWSLMISVELWAVPIVHAFDSPWNLPHGPDNRFGFRRSINRRHPSFSTGARMSARADRGARSSISILLRIKSRSFGRIVSNWRSQTSPCMTSLYFTSQQGKPIVK